jgi:tetratricopeptide (TPR) repeat protein
MEARTAARWLGVLVVMAGAVYLTWQSAVLIQHNAPSRARGSAVAPATVQIGTVDLTALIGQVVGSDGVNERALGAIEGRGEPSLTAAAEFVAGRYEHEHNHDEQALRHMQRAVNAAPSNAGLHTWCATLLLNSGQTASALTEAERAAELEPESADAQRILGQAYYGTGRLPEAITALEHSLRLTPNAELSEHMEKARREAAVEQHFTEDARGHFVLRYEGGQPTAALSDELWRALERDYDQLAADLGFTPSTTITVVLYSQQQFSDVTKAPAWAGAINDGKLRIPTGDLRNMTPQLDAMLRHELTHSFVHSAVPHCPVWLNEGLAQMEEPRSVEALPTDLRQAVRPGSFVPLAKLEGSFQKMNPEDAKRAYVESLAAVEFMRSAKGMEGLRWMLRKLSEGEQNEAALRGVVFGGYEELDRETEASLAKYNAAAN